MLWAHRLKPSPRYDPFRACSSITAMSVLVSAGYIVKQMGIPLKLVAMVNSNDIVHRAVTTGDFSMATHVTQTLAPAIDIQVIHDMWSLAS